MENEKISEQKFWKLINLIDWKQKDNEKVLQPLIKALTASNEAVIYQFSERLAFYLHQLDGPAYTKALAADELGFSADTFLYARCLAVAKGKQFYEKVLTRPENMPVGEDFEALLYVAEEAYLQKTGKIYKYISSINYESFSNKKLWKEKIITRQIIARIEKRTDKLFEMINELKKEDLTKTEVTEIANLLGNLADKLEAKLAESDKIS